ncbi:hypothetical protein B3286c1_1153 [Brucella vulpis]|uniref:hypothetical protein n=1 Tax=Brucella vulpis TaxID=981386 RepID=UPI00073ACA32|nr:hypothetical protein BF3285c1_1154 [Brucella vulpis]CUW49975.1 hypothetical protein B3286c1_1153 [Brucella vulpis]
MKNPSIFGSSQKRGVLIPICSRFESVTFRESEAILTLPEVCQQSEPPEGGLKCQYRCIAGSGFAKTCMTTGSAAGAGLA